MYSMHGTTVTWAACYRHMSAVKVVVQVLVTNERTGPKPLMALCVSRRQLLTWFKSSQLLPITLHSHSHSHSHCILKYLLEYLISHPSLPPVHKGPTGLLIGKLPLSSYLDCCLQRPTRAAEGNLSVKFNCALKPDADQARVQAVLSTHAHHARTMPNQPLQTLVQC
jgi:hypothetical protein